MELGDLLLKLDANTDQLRILIHLVEELTSKVDRVQSQLHTHQPGGSAPG